MQEAKREGQSTSNEARCRLESSPGECAWHGPPQLFGRHQLSDLALRGSNGIRWRRGSRPAAGFRCGRGVGLHRWPA
eukprot:scaffold434_cov186-Pinguiococcus_pyrenoidosus.AAC.108